MVRKAHGAAFSHQFSACIVRFGTCAVDKFVCWATAKRLNRWLIDQFQRNVNPGSFKGPRSNAAQAQGPFKHSLSSCLLRYTSSAVVQCYVSLLGTVLRTLYCTSNTMLSCPVNSMHVIWGAEFLFHNLNLSTARGRGTNQPSITAQFAVESVHACDGCFSSSPSFLLVPM